MLLVDDLLMVPLKGIFWVFQEIHKAATEEQRARHDQIMADLSALYVSLEQGVITDEMFDVQEQALLDELDALDARTAAEGNDGDDEDGDGESGSRVAVVDASPAARNALIFGAPNPSPVATDSALPSSEKRLS